ncbi:hypothetical protein RclHR1_24590001 [Rhizophagus clarus]|uniref:Uncharacterized protein n=1 Tax=Rhizophagus clarus TaxID=94130 RepID=A0A2Z6QY37_9GLOM|nr:hypothetical protein RclHR1_24590001 [Rhizophagus clarus]
MPYKRLRPTHRLNDMEGKRTTGCNLVVNTMLLWLTERFLDLQPFTASNTILCYTTTQLKKNEKKPIKEKRNLLVADLINYQSAQS